MNGSSTYREQEYKLNAPTQDAIEEVWDFVLSDSHYCTVETDKSSKTNHTAETDKLPRPKGLSKLKLQKPHEITTLRRRVYCDTLNLQATRQGIDIRLQYSPNEKTELMVKVPTKGVKGDSDGTMDRLEYSSKLKQGSGNPDLTTLEKACTQQLKTVFDGSSLKDVALYPLLQIITQRRKMHYRPHGHPNTEIELSMDIGVGETCLGQEWFVFQIELELVKGEIACLKAETKLLKKEFALTLETRSKPAPGFELLGPHLDGKYIRAIVARELKNSDFRNLESQVARELKNSDFRNLKSHAPLHGEKPRMKFTESAIPT